MKKSTKLIIIFLLIGVAVWIAVSSFAPKASTNNADKVAFLLDWKAGMEYTGFFVAKEKGYYQAEGLDVDIQDGNSSTVSAKLVAAGQYNLGMATGDAIAISVENKMPIKSIAVLFQQTPVVIYSLKTSGITKPEDLAGKTIGVSTGDTKYNYFRGLVGRLKLNEAKINEVAVDWEIAPLLTGKVDALLGYINNQPVQVEMHGKPVNIIKLQDYGMNLYNEAVIANTNFLLAHPDVVRRFLQASVKGWEYAIEHPAEAVSIVAKLHPEQDAVYLQKNFDQIIPLMTTVGGVKVAVGNQTLDRWKNTVDVLREVGLLKTSLDPSLIFTSDFVDKRLQ